MLALLHGIPGMLGSCVDVTCLHRSPLWQELHGSSMFGDGQYLLGNSGYINTSHLVCSFKWADQGVNREHREEFNTCVAKVRVTNEHCIGVLKSQWHSLKQVRVQLKEKKDNVHMVCWIGLCEKLHNFVILQNDLWTKDDDEGR